MITVNESISKLNSVVGKRGKLAFFSTFIVGILTHMSILTSDIPNHDGLQSVYFDQNMITSGRWFLGTACGISSFFSLPWLIGVLSILYISIAAIFLCDLLKIENPVWVVLCSSILVTYPSLSSNFAYVFTMDGYMLGMLLCVVAVWAAPKGKLGWLIGAVCLAFGMGCYQSYICISMILCLFKVGEILCSSKYPQDREMFKRREGDKAVGSPVKEKLLEIARYAGMGIAGVALYYICLRVLLLIQGKELDTYQGINGMASGNGAGLLGTVKLIYKDFFTFTAGNVVVPNALAGICLLLLAILAIVLGIRAAVKTGLLKKPLFYVGVVAFSLALPIAMNGILLISTEVTYHVLMRYQWAFMLVVLVASINSFLSGDRMSTNSGEIADGAKEKGSKVSCCNVHAIAEWIIVAALFIVSFSYMVNDNIAYSNLQKKYEKTYAYCLRLADRIEQTEGYYEGIPIAMVGVVGNDSYPLTDVTEDVTGGLLGISGDYLLYKSENYADFFKYYMGISFNMVSSDEVINFYNEDFYAEMESFPHESSVLLHDGVIYVKTENQR